MEKELGKLEEQKAEMEAREAEEAKKAELDAKTDEWASLSEKLDS